jgi:hypothetical protein
MLVGHVNYDDPELGFSITSALKKVGNVAVKTVTVPTKYAYQGTKAVGKLAYKGIEWTAIKPTEWLAHKIMAPVKNRVQKIVHRRAAKLAYDSRKSTTPTPAEVSQARSWTRGKLMHELPHGPALAIFAGHPEVMDMLGDHQLGVAPAVAAAAVPIFMALAQQLLNRFSSSGEAPANPQADASADASAPDAPAPAGTVDLQPVQDAAQDVAEAVDKAAGKGKRGGKGGTVTLPGGMQVKKSYLAIGGAVLGGVILLSLFTRKKS